MSLASRPKTPAPKYDESVFINCPFDDGYKPLFEAVVFAVLNCGYTPRCALELSNSGQVRIGKINDLIAGCRFGIHDISRTEPDPVNHLPRFNMPLELGLFLGCQTFGGHKHKHKSCLIFDFEKYRYQKFISDIAGQDIKAHGQSPERIIKGIRDWLRPHSPHPLPGGQHFADLFAAFQAVLPNLCHRQNLVRDELEFVDLVAMIRATSTPGRPAP